MRGGDCFFLFFFLFRPPPPPLPPVVAFGGLLPTTPALAAVADAGREEEGTKALLSWLPALRSAWGWMSVTVVGCPPPGCPVAGCGWLEVSEGKILH